jgi:hypothetical protein
VDKTLRSLLMISTCLTVVAWVAGGQTALAGSDDDLRERLTALERENAAIRKENALLRANKELRRENTALRSVSGPAPASTPVGVAEAAAGLRHERNPMEVYAADLPIKAPRVIETTGQFRVWGEGGAIWSGGTSRTMGYGSGDIFSALLGSSSGVFELKPKVGWEAAGGFDYRFANSPWHVSGQFRYGRSGKASGEASSAYSADPAILDILSEALFQGGAQLTSLTGGDRVSARYNETHWLADLAVGRDVLGSGPNTMQVKFGVRMAEFSSRLSTSRQNNVVFTVEEPLEPPVGPPFDTIAIATGSSGALRSSFLGIGPRIGIEGSVPFAGKWSFDYLGDVAVLFGRQRLRDVTTSTTAITPPIAGLLFGGGLPGSFTSTSTATDERTATVVNADLQAGVSYWMTPNVKLSASYRVDAYFGVLNTTFNRNDKQTIDRYIHGPRLGVLAQF